MTITSKTTTVPGYSEASKARLYRPDIQNPGVLRAGSSDPILASGTLFMELVFLYSYSLLSVSVFKFHFYKDSVWWIAASFKASLWLNYLYKETLCLQIRLFSIVSLKDNRFGEAYSSVHNTRDDKYLPAHAISSADLIAAIGNLSTVGWFLGTDRKACYTATLRLQG